MSTSYEIIGIIDPDDKYIKMKEVWDACKTARIEPPDEVSEFFRWEEPLDCGRAVELETTEINGGCDSSGGATQLLVSDIPNGVTKIQLRSYC